MWQMLCAEMKYNLLILLLWSVIIPNSVVIKYYESNMSIMPVMMILLWVIVVKIRAREKRDRQTVLLPVPITAIASIRLLIIIVPCIIFILQLVLLNNLTVYKNVISLKLGMTIFGLILLIYSLFCIFYDLATKRSKNTLRTAQMTIVLLFVIPTILGIIILILIKNSSILTDQITTFFTRINPFSGSLGVVKFFLFSMVIAGLSVLTFSARKSYCER